VEKGPGAVRAALDAMAGAGPGIAVVDAITDDHLMTIGAALDGIALVTGGSGVAMGLPENFRRAGLLGDTEADAGFDAPAGATIMLAGSCSAATRTQVDTALSAVPGLALDPDSLATDGGTVDRAIAWARERLAAGPAIIYSSAEPEAVARVQQRHGRDEAGRMVEQAFGRIAAALGAAGASRFIVAGG